jgi:YD repeat-containing protein
MTMPSDIPNAAVRPVRRVRRLARFAGVVLLAITLAVAALIWTGPLISGALFLSWPTGKAPVAHDLPQSYEPVHKGHIDDSTGLYIREDEDLLLRHTPPFVVTRTYLSGDHVSRQFGIGTTDNAEWYLIGDAANLSWAELILADGGRIHFDRLSRGKSIQTALFVHQSTPTGFYGSRLGWGGLDWILRFQDGGIARFQGCGPDQGSLCSLTQLRDEDGHVLRFHRDGAGRLQTIEAPTERIVFEYDDRGRIIRAHDDAGHRLGYAYDAGGRLVQVVDVDGTVRSYTYSAKDEMLTIREPGWFIDNTFDAGGRVTRQVTVVSGSPGDGGRPGTYVIEFAYKVSQGRVTETNVKQYDGTHTLYRFNDHHYVHEQVLDAEGSRPISVSYDRDPTGQFAIALTVRCAANGQMTTATARIDGDEEQTKQDLILRTCPPKN